MRPRITISKENYLKAIAEAQSEGETVKAVTLSRWLGVSAPAVTMAIKRLRRDRLIRVGPEGQITLAAAGSRIANRLLNRHHLIERMLAEIFGLEWYKVHDEAEQLEHAVSADFERKLIEKLGAGNACPHGNILGMDSPAARRSRGLKPLDEAHAGDEVAVVSVFERDRALLEYLDGQGIRPGAQCTIIAADGRIEARIDSRGVRLERTVASKIWVKLLAGCGNTGV
ncbi:MAG TPA: metal-dependent transcriptional regulator [Candidatus Solibacter sp.]|nr:metal-dependent transcriptional regulator [Candidatus Solibacter sp.]